MYVFLLLAAAPMPDHAAWTRPLAPPFQYTQNEYTARPFDVLQYDLELDIDRGNEILSGVATVTLVPTEGTLEEVLLDLRQLEVSGVTMGGAPMAFGQFGDSLVVTLSPPAGPSDEVELVITYSGTPFHESWGGFWFHPYVTYQMGVGVYQDDPSMGKCMFPCVDHPSDKAGFSFSVTVPDTLYAVANGDSTGVTQNGDGTLTYHWVQPLPMSTYLAAISVADYEVLHDDDDPRLYYYVYSWDVEDAVGSFQNVDLMMARLESLYGQYPWDCKFSYVQTPKGDMEHQSAVFHIASAINGNTNYDWLLAHEMTHQWWGDCVTEAEWSDVWLSEGFATFGEPLWMETYGWSEYMDYMVSDIMKPYLNSGEVFPLASPSTPQQYWSYTTYQKGAAVLHMLRRLMGDAPFFQALNEYFDEFQFGLATSNDLMEHLENHYGDLTWFFDQWVYGYGYPVYDISYQYSPGQVQITVHQSQEFGTFFEMPLEFLLEGGGQDTLVTMWNDVQDQTAIFQTSFDPSSATFDPSVKVLCNMVLGVDERPSPPPGGTSTLWVYPNPSSGIASIDWQGTESLPLDVALYDVSGRLVHSQVLDPGNRAFTLGALPSGTYFLEARAPGNLRQVSRLLILD
jgi:aminopeptidase N